jgi:hypothetical protein
MSKELCECGKIAHWLYLPSSDIKNPFYCDDCVPRGCSCNEYSIVDEDYHPSGGIEPSGEDGTEGVDWKWVNQEKTLWARIDEKGRRYPCVEFDYDEDGYDEDDWS